MSLSHFDERSGIISCYTNFGKWWQSVSEIHIEIFLAKKTTGKDLRVVVTPRTISVSMHGNMLLQGELFYIVHPDDTVWTLEDRIIVHIMLSKVRINNEDLFWEALYSDASFAPDAMTMHEMKKKFDLEKFQLSNPGMDFSQAKLQSCYDTPKNMKVL